MPSPPKPWERAGVANTANSMSTVTTQAVNVAPSVASSSTAVENPTAGNAPTVPARPASLTAPISTSLATSSALTSAGAYGNMYSSPYSRFGSSYSPYGTSYGGGYAGYGGIGGMYSSSPYGSTYGSPYGGVGGGYGYGGMPGMMPGMPGMDPSQTLSAQLSNTTAQTFNLLHSIVQTFGGFAQMLDSTFMATHSSFFAMVGVIDQFAALRDVLGQVLGVFGLVRWVKGVLSGEGVVPRSALSQEFEAFVTRQPGGAVGPNGQPKPSKKPIIVFFLAIIGIPYLMHKLIKRLSERPPVLPDGTLLSQQQHQLSLTQPGATLDPSKLTFAHALYEFNTTSPQELVLKKGDIVAILLMTDPVTGSLETEWWQGRTRDGREGWFPRKFVEIIVRKGQETPAGTEGKKV